MSCRTQKIFLSNWLGEVISTSLRAPVESVKVEEEDPAALSLLFSACLLELTHYSSMIDIHTLGSLVSQILDNKYITTFPESPDCMSLYSSACKIE